MIHLVLGFFESLFKPGKKAPKLWEKECYHVDRSRTFEEVDYLYTVTTVALPEAPIFKMFEKYRKKFDEKDWDEV